MPSVEELLNVEPLAETGQAKQEGIYCIINSETRIISVPAEYSLLGVESDENVERLWFQCPKIVGDNIDLSTLQLRVNYQNANSQKDQYIVTDMQVEGDNVIFSWLLSRKVTAYRGSVSFIVCAVKVSGETIQNEWNTTLASAQVLQGLEVDDPEPTEEESDVIAQLIQIMTDTSEQAVADVGSAKESAISAITAQQSTSVSAVQSAQNTAVQAVENAGELITESLPDDYVELSDKVDELDRGKAPAITESTSGESIQLSDSGDAPLTDIKLYGKSKQVTTTGAQLLDVSRKQSGIININNGEIINNDSWEHVDKISIKPETSYTLSEKSKGNFFQYKVGFYDGSLQFISGNDVVNGNNNYSVFESPPGSAYITVSWSTSVSGIGVTREEIMLNKGSSALPWEPYTGGKVSPNPDYPQEIAIPGSGGGIEVKVQGTNILNFNKEDYTTNINGVFEKSSGCKTCILVLHSGDSIYISGDFLLLNSSVLRIGKFDSYPIAGAVGKRISLTGNGTVRNENDENLYVALSFLPDYGKTFQEIQDSFMVNYGETALPFEPYKEQALSVNTPNGLPGIPVSSGGSYTDEQGQQWVCDEIDFKRGKYVQRVKKSVVGNWSLYSSQDESGSTIYFSTNISGRYVGNDFAMITNSFIFSNENYIRMGVNEIRADTSGDGIQVRVLKSEFPDVSSFDSFLSEHPLYVLYILASPIETNLTTEQLTALKQLRTYQTVANITTDSEPQVGMEVEYTADTKTYIDNKIKEVLSQLAGTQSMILQEE